MSIPNKWLIGGGVVLGVLILGGLITPRKFVSQQHLQRLKSETEMRQLASSLIAFAEDHCDNFPPSVANLPNEALDQYGFDTVSLVHHSYITTKDRSRLVVFERTGTWDDHTITYLELNTKGDWTQMITNGFDGMKFNRATEEQFAEYIAKLESPPPFSSPTEDLLTAVESGDLQMVESIIGTGNSINEEDQRGWTPLTLAAQEGQSKIVELLISKGARVDLRDGFGMRRTALMRACTLGHANIVEKLLDQRADILIKREDGSNALIDALPYPIIVSKLISAGADCNEQIRNDWSPLIAACSGGFTESARLLIKHGADLKRDGVTALAATARNGHAGSMNMLLSSGISVDKKILGECLSSAYSHPEAVQELLSAGADLKAKCACPGGRTPLMIAALNGCPETVDLLVKAGVDLNAKDDNGHTALDLMLAETKSEWLPRNTVEQSILLSIVGTLRKAGARESGLAVAWPEPR